MQLTLIISQHIMTHQVGRFFLLFIQQKTMWAYWLYLPNTDFFFLSCLVPNTDKTRSVRGVHYVWKIIFFRWFTCIDVKKKC